MKISVLSYITNQLLYEEERNSLNPELSTLELYRLVFLIHMKHSRAALPETLVIGKEFEKPLQDPCSLLHLPQHAVEGIESMIQVESLLI